MKGYVRGFDVRTGKRLWIFHTIPQPGEFGNDTWEKDSWAYTGNTGVWGADLASTKSSAWRICRSRCRPATTTAAIVPATACSAKASSPSICKTGKRKWHYQLVHHGIWDMDIPCAPILADITVNGRTVKAVAQPTKQGVALRVRSRDRPADLADRGAAGSERRRAGRVVLADAAVSDASRRPTSAQGVSIDDLIDFTPELRAEAVELVAKYKMGPMFTPPVVSKLEGPLGTADDGALAAARTGRAGRTIPRRTSLYVYLDRRDRLAWASCRRQPGFSDMRYISGNALTGARRTGGSGSAAGGGRSRGRRRRDAAGRGRRRRRRRRPDRSGLPLVQAAVREDHARSISTRARSTGRSRTARRRTTSGIIRRSRA